MHRFAALMFGTFALFIVSRAQAAEPSASAGPSTAQEFLSMIKQVADSGDITQPGQIAQLFHMNLAPGRSGDSTNPAEVCANASNPKATTRRSAFDSYVANGEPWFKRRPEGAPVSMGDPAFRYVNFRFTRCAGRHAIAPEMSSEVTFNNVPGFLCIREADARAYLMGNSPPTIGDGATVYYYRGKVTEDYGTGVTLSFQQGCAIGVKIAQEMGAGLRTRRALREFNDCLEKRRAEGVLDRDGNSRYCAESIADY